MAAGHVLPGFGDPVSRLHRVRSVKYPLDRKTLLEIEQKTRLQKDEFEQIKRAACDLWQYPQNNETTYDTFFSERRADDLMVCRPTSPGRRNKPHPTPVFLTTRLHYIPGLHNAETTVGKEAYKVDASCPPNEKKLRQAMRQKYQSHLSDAMVEQYKDAFGLTKDLEPRAAQAAEAWLKIADDSDREAVIASLRKERENIIGTTEKGGHRPHTSVPSYASVNRWMRYAGAREADAVGRIVGMIQSGPNGGVYNPHLPENPYHSRPYPQNLLEQREKDIAATVRVQFQRPKPSRGDFLMHPDWPPSIYHHRIP